MLFPLFLAFSSSSGPQPPGVPDPAPPNSAFSLSVRPLPTLGPSVCFVSSEEQARPNEHAVALSSQSAASSTAP
ncbi:hypothetical protein EI827_23740 [Salmonella enterica subsp. enterica serovar Oranienburg]|nr:hypothetical protein [Salmonella enterica subsp. enterica serovar Oranienburg]ECA1475073.1 hypothetical protein [Salmonella enterica subsp. enterica serovar Oranienburg]ECA9000951.1 hypothetical protein [Salmonella enterica subsp. enterica serovar Oranienburg]ECA9347794.1 hypothetical protein [Salmonella enterica subsp. enterica serovar Oranienburg]